MSVDNPTRVPGELRLSSSFAKPPLAPVSNNNQASLSKDMLTFAHGEIFILSSYTDRCSKTLPCLLLRPLVDL